MAQVQTSIKNIKQEVLNFLRSSDLIAVATRGVTTATETFNGDGSTATFTFSHTNVQNIRSVTVDSVSKTYGVDYIFNITGTSQTITFLTGHIPGAGTANISVSLDYGNSDRIFPDYPQTHAKVGDFPRIGFDIISGLTSEMAIGGQDNQSTYIISIVAYASSPEAAEDLVIATRAAMLAAKKSFYYSPFITPIAIGPTITAPFGQNKLFSRNVDFKVQFVFE